MDHPIERNTTELQRLRQAIEDGQPIDLAKELTLADYDDALAMEHYTREAIERTKQTDKEQLEPNAGN